MPKKPKNQNKKQPPKRITRFDQEDILDVGDLSRADQDAFRRAMLGVETAAHKRRKNNQKARTEKGYDDALSKTIKGHLDSASSSAKMHRASSSENIVDMEFGDILDAFENQQLDRIKKPSQHMAPSSKEHDPPSKPKRKNPYMSVMSVGQALRAADSLKIKKTPDTLLHDYIKRIVKKTKPQDFQAVLDLHGMNLGRAFDAFKQFVYACIEKKLQVGLVITGYGKFTAPEKKGKKDHEKGNERGVIRANFPYWCRDPEIMEHIISFEAAHKKDGGKGAFYVHFRRRR